MRGRQIHQQEVSRYLQRHFSINDWNVSFPRGSGMETYYAKGNGQEYFVKVGAPVERYVAVAEIGLTPPIIAYGELEDGLSIMIQPLIHGQTPSQADFCNRLEKVAALIHTMHDHQRIKDVLPAASSNHYKDAGRQVLNRLHLKWKKYKAQVPMTAEFVDSSLERLAQQVNLFLGEGLVVSHNDICNANWLFASDGKVYIFDFESMSMDDPAADLGALLWWYYPPALRQRFLEIAGYRYNHEFKFRMQIRMAIHCLSITLPRDQSFDSFNPGKYSESLDDFRAILDGRENPKGYLV